MAKRKPPGTVFAVELGEGSFAAARALMPPTVAFSDRFHASPDDIDPERLGSPAFRIAVMDHAVGGDERPATREEVADLEAAAVWDPEHVEDRLRDLRDGRPDKWVESLSP